MPSHNCGQGDWAHTGHTATSRSHLPASFPSAPLGGDTGFEENMADVEHMTWAGQSELSVPPGHGDWFLSDDAL